MVEIIKSYMWTFMDGFPTWQFNRLLEIWDDLGRKRLWMKEKTKEPYVCKVLHLPSIGDKYLALDRKRFGNSVTKQALLFDSFFARISTGCDV